MEKRGRQHVDEPIGYLLSRNAWWPDRDEEETPAPLPERWIEAKQASRGENLGLDDLSLLGQLTDAQLDGLSAYRDGGTAFRLEVSLARRHRWVWALLRSLPEGKRKAARSPDGLPVRDLDVRQRTFLIDSVRLRADWNSVRLYVAADGSSSRPEAQRPFSGVWLKEEGTAAPIWGQWLPPTLPH